VDAGWQQDDDALGRELDAALAKYAAVEPRAGLENRILANLRSEHSRVPVRAWWGWSAAVAMLVVVMALLWSWEKPSRPVIVVRPSNSTQGSREEPKQFVSTGGEGGVPARTSSPARKRIRHASPVVAAVGPKLDQFPSPQPLTDQ